MEIEEFIKIVGKNLKYYRTKAGLTKALLSRKSGVSIQAIFNIEECKISPRLYTIYKLANALDIKADDFVK